MSFFRLVLCLIFLSLSIVACRKDNSSFVSEVPGSSNCNSVEMKLKKIQATSDERFYLSAEWNSDNTVKMLELNDMLAPGLNASYVYENGKIKEAVLRYIDETDIDDTCIYHYNTEGKVDSIYLKDDKTRYGGNIKLSYTGGKLTKLIGYSGTEPKFYWDITTDGNQNITKAVEYHKSETGYTKENTFTYTRDGKKNPLKNLAVYMLCLDDPYVIFRYWGDNNYTDQRYEGHTDPVVDLTTGSKFKYNENCYPKSSVNTISGVPLMIDDQGDWLYTYY